VATSPRRGTVYVSLACRVPSRGAGGSGHGTSVATTVPHRALSENYSHSFTVFTLLEVFELSVYFSLSVFFVLFYLLFVRKRVDDSFITICQSPEITQ
jgi:hypothetical protein